MWSLGTLAKLNAQAAAELSAKSKDANLNHDACRLLAEAHRQIRKAAEQGEFSIPDPFDGLGLPSKAKRMARERLIADGYVIDRDGWIGWKKPEKKRKVRAKA